VLRGGTLPNIDANTVIDGGCIWSFGASTLDHAIVEQCYANHDGGAIFNYTGGTVNVLNSTLRNNTAKRDCGAICDYGDSVTVSGRAILSNTAATRNVGGIGSVGSVQVNNSTIRGNWALGNGSGLYSNVYLPLSNPVLTCSAGLPMRPSLFS
jgi:hypothetical protein